MLLMVISMIVMGVCFYCKEYDIVFAGSSILPVFCLVVYVMALGAGINNTLNPRLWPNMRRIRSLSGK